MIELIDLFYSTYGWFKTIFVLERYKSYYCTDLGTIIVYLDKNIFKSIDNTKLYKIDYFTIGKGTIADNVLYI